MDQKNKQSISHANVNVNLIKKNVIPINSRIIINVDAKKVKFGILLHTIVKRKKISN